VTGKAPALDAERGSIELLERASELSVLGAALDRVRKSSHGQIVLLGGEAGAGKTSLLRRFREDCAQDVRILSGGCEPLFTPHPLGPLLAVAEDVGGELDSVVESGVMPHEVVSALVRELRAHAPTVFVLEDVHWADEATLDVLRLLALRIENVPALVVATYRDDELERAQPLRTVLGELATAPSAERLKLALLSPDAVAELAAPYAADAGELYRKTGGNPFFVAEVLAARADEIPETVRDAVFARASRLSADAKRLLEAVAIVPSHTEPWLLEALAGDAIVALDECLSSGMLNAEVEGLAFRHELARLAVDESIAPSRKTALHRQALASLAAASGRHHDLARLAHHAEAAGDEEAVLRYAPEAAAGAAKLGAHREAVAQYERALRAGNGLSPDERAHLLEQCAASCLVTDQYDKGIDALQQALALRRVSGDVLGEGDAQRRLSEFLWCPGRTDESEQLAREAVAVLERLPAGPELGMAYANLATVLSAATRTDEAIAWGTRAIELAKQLGETSAAIHALVTVAACEEDYEKLKPTVTRALDAGLTGQASRAYAVLAGSAVQTHRNSVAREAVEIGSAFCSERGIELSGLYLRAHRARLELHEGNWTEAADAAAWVLRTPRTSTTPRILALAVIGLLRARRGDPAPREPLDEAWALAEPTGELERLGVVAAALAEVAWLEGDAEGVDSATRFAFELALERRSGWMVGELGAWRRRAGLPADAGESATGPYALLLDGRPLEAAAQWKELGCPYEAALALGDADEDEPLREALEEMQRLDAPVPAALIARRLRERGVRGVPRGPRAATQRNPGGLTPREHEVLTLVAEGMRNAEIAARLVVSERTVDHHVAAVFRKLDVCTRADAAATAVRLGVVAQDR